MRRTSRKVARPSSTSSSEGEFGWHAVAWRSRRVRIRQSHSRTQVFRWQRKQKCPDCFGLIPNRRAGTPLETVPWRGTLGGPERTGSTWTLWLGATARWCTSPCRTFRRVGSLKLQPCGLLWSAAEGDDLQSRLRLVRTSPLSTSSRRKGLYSVVVVHTEL